MRALAIDCSCRVAKRDSFWIIAWRVFGYGFAWKMIAPYNGLENLNCRRAGWDLTLPLGGDMLSIDF